MWMKGLRLKCESKEEVEEITAEMDELEIFYEVEGLKIRFLYDPEEDIPEELKKKQEEWWKTI